MEEYLEEFLTVKDVARILKFSPDRIYKMVARKQIPFIRFDKRGIRFLRRHLICWYDSICLKPEGVRDLPLSLVRELIKATNPFLSRENSFLNNPGEEGSTKSEQFI